MSQMNSVCPECGGVLNSDRCQFCGAVILDMASIDFDNPCYLKFKRGNNVYRAKCQVDNFSLKTHETPCFYNDNELYKWFRPAMPATISIDFSVIPVDNIWCVLIDSSIAEKDGIRDVYNRQEDQNA